MINFSHDQFNPELIEELSEIMVGYYNEKQLKSFEIWLDSNYNKKVPYRSKPNSFSILKDNLSNLIIIYSYTWVSNGDYSLENYISINDELGNQMNIEIPNNNNHNSYNKEEHEKDWIIKQLEKQIIFNAQFILSLEANIKQPNSPDKLFSIAKY